MYHETLLPWPDSCWIWAMYKGCNNYIFLIKNINHIVVTEINDLNVGGKVKTWYDFHNRVWSKTSTFKIGNDFQIILIYSYHEIRTAIALCLIWQHTQIFPVGIGWMSKIVHTGDLDFDVRISWKMTRYS